MTTIFGLLATLLAQQTPEQAAEVVQQTNAMRIALITIAALAAANVLLVILIATSRKKKSE